MCSYVTSWITARMNIFTAHCSFWSGLLYQVRWTSLHFNTFIYCNGLCFSLSKILASWSTACQCKLLFYDLKHSGFRFPKQVLTEWQTLYTMLLMLPTNKILVTILVSVAPLFYVHKVLKWRIMYTSELNCEYLVTSIGSILSLLVWSSGTYFAYWVL